MAWRPIYKVQPCLYLHDTLPTPLLVPWFESQLLNQPLLLDIIEDHLRADHSQQRLIGIDTSPTPTLSASLPSDSSDCYTTPRGSEGIPLSPIASDPETPPHLPIDISNHITTPRRAIQTPQKRHVTPSLLRSLQKIFSGLPIITIVKRRRGLTTLYKERCHKLSRSYRPPSPSPRPRTPLLRAQLPSAIFKRPPKR